MNRNRSVVVAALCLAACSEKDGEEEREVVPFDLVEESYSGLACEPLDTLACEEDDLVVLAATSVDEFVRIYEEKLPYDPPFVDLDGRVALVAYLPLCPQYDSRLRIDRMTRSGETLFVDALFVEAIDGGDVVACLYTVVTIPETDFTTIETSLTETVAER